MTRRLAGYIARNWITTILGLAKLIALGVAAWHNPAVLLTGEGLGSLTLGIGLVSAQDPAHVATITSALLARVSADAPR